MADWKAWLVGGVVVLSLWESGIAGKALVGGVAATAVAPAAGSAAGAAAGTGAGALASRALGRQPQGQHFPKPTTTTTPAPEAASSSALCAGTEGMLTACPTPGAAGARASAPVAGAPCDITAEPRERILPDNDGDGEPDRVTLPELGCR